MEVGDPAAELPVYVNRKKLLQFRSGIDIGVRPAWWGPFSKTSKDVLARRPFGQDGELDYEFDSEEEWEDEDGEDLVSEDDEEEEPKGKDVVDDEEEDDWLVPDGYLSDGEGMEGGESYSQGE
ncbi:hypothetical protein M427DRAFT_199045 [Gonapodya prolifera JEL478]|uniref:Chromatin assembly factor 1 subunit A dimerization domain-containing protein n=1 Tax=Gonapodya prolifera (strain JEL478) TaxID=1344416 RepID=A0A139AQ31_GONPJ|nr:hypothetical protein M427DRAFT_199045 [Gonapodya prolifera JEL478]|eukprot:KXS18764.1 hypothetical protein M427DRAFT_199045 [Gonapodya prolifera JEL478]